MTDLRTALIDALVMSPMSDHIGTSMAPIDHTADALLPIITAHEAETVASVLDLIDKLHYPANRDLDRTPICTQCHGKAGTHPCGCWQDTDLYPICGECGEQDVLYEWADYPCPTRQLTNQIRQEPTNA